MAEVITRFKVDTNEYNRKVGQAKGMLDKFGLAGKQASQFLGTLGNSLGVNILSFGKLTGAVGLATGAMKVLSGAFKQSESNIDAMAIATEQAKGAYNTFLDTINGGNWSNFFNNLNDAIDGAKDLAIQLDRLGSIRANNAAPIAILQKQLQDLRLRKQNGEDVDSLILQTTDRIAALQKQATNQGMKTGRTQIENIIRSAYQSQNGANPLSGSTLGSVTKKILTQGQSFFDAQAAIYSRLGAKATETTSYTRNDGRGSYTIQQRSLNLEKLTAEEKKQYFLAKAITEAETRIQEGSALYAQAVTESAGNAREELKGRKYGGAGTGRGGNPNPKPQPVPVVFESTFNNTDGIEKILKGETLPVTVALKLGMGDNSSFGDITSELMKGIGQSEWQKEYERGRQRYNYMVNSEQNTPMLQSKEWEGFGKGIGETAKIVGNIENIASLIGVDLGKGFKGLMISLTVITSILETIEAINTIGAITGWFSHGGVVHAANGFAGVVPGQNFSGDRVPALLNSGETVLTAAMTNNLASGLRAINMGGGYQGQPYVQSETIYLGVNAHLKRTGQGEIVTTKMLQQYMR